MTGRVAPGDVLSLDVRFDQLDEETAVCSGHAEVGDRPVLDLAGAILVLTPLELLVDPASTMQRLARMRRDVSAETSGRGGRRPAEPPRAVLTRPCANPARSDHGA